MSISAENLDTPDDSESTHQKTLRATALVFKVDALAFEQAILRLAAKHETSPDRMLRIVHDVALVAAGFAAKKG